MEPFTLDRKFLPQNEISVFKSFIWTERYYGDSDVELVVPLNDEMIRKLTPGTFIGIEESDEVMMLETMNIEEGNMKFAGISILSWLNNRFVRSSASHKDTSWAITPDVPGKILWEIVRHTCHSSSQWLNGSVPIGIPNPQVLIIPGLELKDYDKSGDVIAPAVRWGPVYDVLREIATAYRIGMQITLESATDTAYVLGFRSYKGVDRTSGQTVVTPVRFSPQMDSLTGIKELQSIAALKTWVYAYAPNVTAPTPTTPGEAKLTGTQYTGFDLRALMINTDIDNAAVANDAAKLQTMLNEKAKDGLNSNPLVKAVDGEIVPTNQFKYGRDYNLGDIIEVQGNSDVVQTSRVTEYIRAQDEAGERSYPTVAMLD